MSRDEAPPSTHAATQAWFSLLLANDPNTALVGSLRPPRENRLWAALRRAFERSPPSPLGLTDEMPELRPRTGRWIGAGLALAVGAAAVGLDLWQVPDTAPAASAAPQGERVGTTTLALRSAAPPIAVAANIAPPAPEPLAAAPRAQLSDAPTPASAAAVPAASAAKKKAKAKPLRRDVSRALSRRRAAR
jgi:hypothetical protein